MRRSLAAGTVAGLTLALLASPALAAGHADGAELSVLHGVPDLVVDVYVDGALTLDDFQPGTLAGPLDLPAGTYSVAITAADAVDASAPLLGPVDLPLEAGGSYTAVAHLTADGAPTASLFMNDTSTTATGEGRLTVRHTAAAPAVDVLAGGTPVISGLENPDEAVLDLPAGTVSAAVAAAGTTTPVIGPVDVDIAAGANTIVYAWGSLAAGNLTVAVQVVDGLGAPTFADVGPGQPFYDEIRWLADNDLSTGYVMDGEHYFMPATTLSRQAMAAFLYRYAGEGWMVPDDRQTFSDVSAQHPFYTEIEWMAEMGMAEGYADGTFGGAWAVSREAMVAFLYRWVEPTGWTPADEPAFSDTEGTMFATEIQWAAEVGLVNGYDDGTFRPAWDVSRQATAAFLFRFDQLSQAV